MVAMTADPLGASDRHFPEVTPDFLGGWGGGRKWLLRTDKGSCISAKENNLKFQTVPVEFFLYGGPESGKTQLHH